MQTLKLSRRVGTLEKKLGARLLNRPVRQEEMMYHANPAASAAPT